jgi:hypothetical protein
LVVAFLLLCADLYAAEPEYTRTRELPALKISLDDMRLVLEKAANLLSSANQERGKQPKEIFRSESLRLGAGPDEIEIAGHSFPETARIPKAAYVLSYSYSWPEAPVSRLQLDLRDYERRLTVSGTSVDQVEALSAALEGDLAKHSAIGGDAVRYFGSLIVGFVLLVILIMGGAICINERQWGFLGVPIFSLIGLVLLFVLPLREIFAGFALYQGEPSWIVRYEPQIAFVGLIITIAFF